MSAFLLPVINEIIVFDRSEVEEKLGVSTSWVFKVGKEESIPKTINRGKIMWRKNTLMLISPGKLPQRK